VYGAAGTGTALTAANGVAGAGGGSPTLTLYAKWEAERQTVRYRANFTGASPSSYEDAGSPDYQTDQTGVVVMGYTATGMQARAGYTFLGWSDSQSATAPNGAYAPGGTFTMAAGGVALYAVWGADSQILTYHGNHGADTAYTQSPAYKTDDAATVKTYAQTALTARDGYSFAGWSTNASAAAPDPLYAPSGTFTMPPNAVDLYAVWTQKSVAVTYLYLGAAEYTNQNGPNGAAGTAAGKLASGQYDGVLAAAPTPPPMRAGYVFGGWYEDAGFAGAAWSFAPAGTGTALTTANGVVDAGGATPTLTLRAKWTAVTDGVLNLNANGGTAGTATSLTGLTFDQTLAAQSKNLPTAPPAGPSRTGYIFQGWAESATAASPDFTDANVVDWTSPKSVYAVWESKSLVLSYLYDGSTPYTNQNTASATATMLTAGTYGQAVASKPNPDPSKAGYAFNGWHTTPSGAGSPWVFGVGTGAMALTAANGVAGADGATPTLTLYAGFTANSVPLVYHANHGADALYTQAPAVHTDDTVTAKTYAQTALPARTGYIFAGWAASASAAVADPAYTPGGTFTMPPARLDLYAVWAARTDSVLYFDKNAGDALPGSVASLTGLTYGLTIAGNLQSLPMLEGSTAPSRLYYGHGRRRGQRGELHGRLARRLGGRQDGLRGMARLHGGRALLQQLHGVGHDAAHDRQRGQCREALRRQADGVRGSGAGGLRLQRLVHDAFGRHAVELRFR
jgi:uncharacterized repeat protein (TIGR02543 family)